MKQTSRYIPLVALMGLASVGSALAAELPKEGSDDYTSCWAGTRNDITFSKTYTSFSFEIIGTNRSIPPGGLFDNESFRCVGMNASFAGKNTGSWVCEASDPDGSKRLTSFTIGSDGKQIREAVAGTGKYDGLVTSGNTVEQLGPFPDIKAGMSQGCNHQTGTYKLK
jgi:hypothetical protein